MYEKNLKVITFLTSISIFIILIIYLYFKKFNNNNIYYNLNFFKIYLFYIIIPIIFYLIFIYFDNLLSNNIINDSYKRKPLNDISDNLPTISSTYNIISYISITILFYFLLSHSYEWFIISSESHADLVEEMQDDRFFFKTNILDMPEDKNYISIVNISYLISIIAALILLFVIFLIRTNKH